MLIGREKLMDFTYTRFFFVPLSPIPCPRCYLFMWETMSHVLGPGTAETLQSWASGGTVLSHPLCWTHGLINSEITTVWACS